MARPCSVCVHPDRAKIDASLTRGASYRDIAGQWQLSKSAVERHAKEHVAKPLAALGLDLTETRDRGRGTVPGPEYAAGMLAEMVRQAIGVVQEVVEEARESVGFARRFRDTLEASGMSQATTMDVLAFAKVLEALTGAIDSVVRANGGGLAKLIELHGKLTGEIKPPTLTVQVAIAQLIDTKTNQWKPEALPLLAPLVQRAVGAVIEDVVGRLAQEQRAAERARLWGVAKAGEGKT